MAFVPCLVRSSTPAGVYRYSLGDPLVDSYLAFVGVEPCAPPAPSMLGSPPPR